MVTLSSFRYLVSFLAYIVMFEKTLAALIPHSEDPGSTITYQDTISEGGVAKASLSSYISQRGSLRNMDQDEKSWFLSAYPGIDYVEGNVNKRGNKEGVFMYHGPDFKAPVRILDPSSADEGVLNTQEEMDDLDSGVSTKVLPPDPNLSWGLNDPDCMSPWVYTTGVLDDLVRDGCQEALSGEQEAYLQNEAFQKIYLGGFYANYYAPYPLQVWNACVAQIGLYLDVTQGDTEDKCYHYQLDEAAQANAVLTNKALEHRDNNLGLGARCWDTRWGRARQPWEPTPVHGPSWSQQIFSLIRDYNFVGVAKGQCNRRDPNVFVS